MPNHVTPDISVIILTSEQDEDLTFLIRALNRQTIKSRIELVFVCLSKDTFPIDTSSLKSFHSIQIIEINNFNSSANARVKGIRAAQAPVVVFTETHSFPNPEWAEMLLSRYSDNVAGVGALFRNGNPWSLTSWAHFLVEYGSYVAPDDADNPRDIPGHNSSYLKAALLNTYGDNLEEVLEAEAPMQWKMKGMGYTFLLEPKARSYHLNFSKISNSLIIRFSGGRLFASHRCENWPLAKRLFFGLASPLIPLVRLTRCLKAAYRLSGFPLAFRLVPVLAFLLIIDGLGEFTGYLFGRGESMKETSDLEINRRKLLQENDLKRLENFERYLDKIYSGESG